MAKETKEQRAQAKAVKQTMAMSFADFSAGELVALYQFAQSNRMMAGAKNWEGNRDILRHRQFRCMELALADAIKNRGNDIPPDITDWRVHISEAIESNTYGYEERKAAEDARAYYKVEEYPRGYALELTKPSLTYAIMDDD